MTMALPPGFAALEPFVTRWALPGESARAAARSAASDSERQAFYDVAQPLARDALAYLDGRDLAALDAADAQLMRLMLSLATVYQSIEVLGDQEATNARARERLILADRLPY